MKIIKPSAQLIDITPSPLQKIEQCGRICYKSERNITQDSAVDFVKMLLNKGHESVLEHAMATIKFITNRGVSHELVRHRIASFSQESTRYVNYSLGKFDRSITCVFPSWILNNFKNADFDGSKNRVNTNYDHSSGNMTMAYHNEMVGKIQIWETALNQCEKSYFSMLIHGLTPQEARGVLPNDLKTEIVVTANFREWRTILKQRTNHAAHPDMRIVMNEAAELLSFACPVVFDEFKKESL